MKTPGSSKKHGEETNKQPEAQKLAATGFLDALPFLDPASLTQILHWVE